MSGFHITMIFALWVSVGLIFWLVLTLSGFRVGMLGKNVADAAVRSGEDRRRQRRPGSADRRRVVPAY